MPDSGLLDFSALRQRHQTGGLTAADMGGWRAYPHTTGAVSP